MPRILLSLTLLSFASTAAAAIFVEPPQPREGEPLKIVIRSSWRDSCVPVVRDVFVPQRGTIILTYKLDGHVCMAAVTDFTATAEIRGGLTAGAWRAEFRFIEDVVKPLTKSPLDFDVAETSEQQPIIVGLPVGGSSGGLITPIHHVPCPNGDCSGARVLFGKNESPRVESSGSVIRAMVPAGGGLVDVVVRIGAQEWRIPSGFQYVSTYSYETILLPGFTEQVIAGAFGSQWKVEHGVYNANHIDLRAGIDFMHVEWNCAGACPEPPPLKARSTGALPSMFAFTRGPDWIVYVRRELAEHLSFSMRVRDLSRQSGTWGTEVPVVRSRDFRQLVQLVDIPLQVRFRQTLRVYALPERLLCCMAAQARFYSMSSGALLHERHVPVGPAPYGMGGFETPSIGSPEFPLQPESGTLDLLSAIPELADEERVRIELDTYGGARQLWAFVAVTNNETQHVTLVTPQ